MIASHWQLGPEVVTAGVWSLACFGLGVSWAAYRAVGWVDRMRSWARSVEVDQ